MTTLLVVAAVRVGAVLLQEDLVAVGREDGYRVLTRLAHVFVELLRHTKSRVNRLHSPLALEKCKIIIDTLLGVPILRSH